MTAIENKIPIVSNLVKTTDYNTKVTEIKNKLNNHNHEKYIDTSEFNKLTVDIFNARITEANLVTKADFDTKLSSLDKKITQNKTKHLLVEDELNKLKTFDSSYFIGKIRFDEDGAQSYLVFQLLIRYFKILPNTSFVLSWKSKGLSAESIIPNTSSPVTASGYHLMPTLSYSGTKTKLKFSGSYLKQDKISYTHEK